MNILLEQLRKTYPGIAYQAGESYFWSPSKQIITYRDEEETLGAEWALLHETAHALLEHQNYQSDLELLLLESAAWHKAKKLGKKFDIEIDEEHIQDCLDTYRDWLHQRSTCPRCSVVSLQVSKHEYRCHNCNASWRVSTSRFCRPYRLSKQSDKIKSRSETSEATFQ